MTSATPSAPCASARHFPVSMLQRFRQPPSEPLITSAPLQHRAVTASLGYAWRRTVWLYASLAPGSVRSLQVYVYIYVYIYIYSAQSFGPDVRLWWSLNMESLSDRTTQSSHQQWSNSMNRPRLYSLFEPERKKYIYIHMYVYGKKCWHIHTHRSHSINR